MADLTRVAEVLAAHQPTDGATGCVGGWLRHCVCTAQIETLWDRDGEDWDRPFAAHQAQMLADAGLVASETEWGHVADGYLVEEGASEEGARRGGVDDDHHFPSLGTWPARAYMAPAELLALWGVLDEVLEERVRQHQKWGQQNHADGTGSDTTPLLGIDNSSRHASLLADRAKAATDKRFKDGTGTYADVFLEEVFEAMAESDRPALRTELIQCAAVVVAWVEKLDREAVTQ